MADQAKVGYDRRQRKCEREKRTPPFPLGLAPFNKKEGPPPPPLPFFSPVAGEQTLNYILKVPLALAGSEVANPESHTPRGAARGVYPGPESG